MWSAEAAAWVQAVGSIIAIVASVGVVLWQNRANEKARRRQSLEDDARHLEAAFQMVGGAAMVCRNYLKVPREQLIVPDNLAKFIAQLTAINDALATLDHTRVGGYVGIEAVLSSLSISRALVATVQHTTAQAFNKAVDAGFVQSICNDAESQLSQRTTKLDQHVQKLKKEIG